MTENFLFAFFITLLTGLATSIGGFAAFFVKKNDFKILSFIFLLNPMFNIFFL